MALVQRLMLRLLPYRWRDSVEGDIEEERRERLEAGERAGTLWFVTYGGRLIASIAADEVRDFLGRRQGFTPADIAADFRYGSRVLRASPGYFFGVLGSLSIGIAAMAVGFSIIDAAYFRPFDGVGNQSQLTRITLDHQDALRADSDFPERMRMLDEQLSSFQSIAAHYPVEFAVAAGHRVSTLEGALVSANFFDVLQMRSAAGRFLEHDKHQLQPRAVISYRLWADHFGKTPDITGRTISVNGADVVIVGVAAEGFRGVLKPASAEDVWIPVSASVGNNPRPPFSFTALGRLHEGITVRQAQSEAAVASTRLGFDRGAGAREQLRITPLRRGEQDRNVLLAMMALPVLIFLMACWNASSLVVADAMERSGQWGTRVALGAGRWRLIRLKLAEDLLLALAAAVVGLLLTAAGLVVLLRSAPLAVRVDYRIVAATAMVAAGAPLLFGLIPASRVARLAGRLGLTGGRASSSHRRSGALLIAGQSAVAIGLLCTGGQFLKTIEARLGDDGLESPERLAIATVDSRAARFDRQETDDYFAGLLERVRSLPHVAAVAQSCDCELWGLMSNEGAGTVWTRTTAAPRRVVSVFAGGDFFSALGLAFQQGSAIPKRDPPRDIVIVNASFAEHFLNGGGMGEELDLAPVTAAPIAARRVVVAGIVAVPVNRHAGGLARKRHDSRPAVYSMVPLAHLPARKLYVRFDRSPDAGSLHTLQALIIGSAPGVALRSFLSGDEARYRNHAPMAWIAYSVTSVGVLALLLATGGLFCLVSSSVSHRAREIAIRMALGAPPMAVSILFVRRAFYPVGVGCVLGGLIAVGAAGVLQSRLYGASLFNPEAFGIAALALLLTMSFASAVPAMRAARTEPCQVLRSE